MTIATYPQYTDANDSSSWKLGNHDEQSVVALFSSMVASANRAWMIRTHPLPLEPGTYHITGLTAHIRNVSDTNCDGAFVTFWRGDLTSLQRVTLDDGSSGIDITADKGADTAHVMESDFTGVSLTIEDGYDYHFGIALRGTPGRTAQPGIGRMNNSQLLHLPCWQYAADSEAVPDELTVKTSSPLGGAVLELRFTTSVRQLTAVLYGGSAKGCPLPIRTDGGDYWVFFSPLVVQDGSNMITSLYTASGGNANLLTTYEFDFGATNQITFGGQSVGLEDDEPGDTFTTAINVRVAAGKMDLFYLNRDTAQGPEKVGGLDTALFCHGTKYAGARDSAYTLAPPGNCLIGTASASTTVKVGWEPCVVFGDSQTVGHLNDYPPVADHFTHKRMAFVSGVNGGKIATTVANNHTAGYLRYKHTTPGLGDICEMTGILFVWCGFGVNDIYPIKTEADRQTTLPVMMARTIEILGDLATRGEKLLIMGLPPRSVPGEGTNVNSAQFIKDQWNPALEGLAIGLRAAFLNPWWDMVDRTTVHDDIPTFAFTDDGSHYSAAGAAIIKPLMALAYESNKVGGPWVKRGIRGRMPGLLVPFL